MRHKNRQGFRVCARQHPRQPAGGGEGRDGGCRVGRGEQLGQLGADPFARQTVEPLDEFGAGGKALGVDLVAVPGVEAEEAQDAQIVLADALAGVLDEPHPPRLRIGSPPSGSTSVPSASA